MNQRPSEALAAQMHAMKDLYAELFLLLLGSVERAADATTPPALDHAIDQLMLTIDTSMREFLGSVRSARNDRSISESLDGEIIQFEDQLKTGLSTMHAGIQARMAEMARERDELKGQLQLIQRKRNGSRGYRKGFLSAATVEPVQASA